MTVDVTFVQKNNNEAREGIMVVGMPTDLHFNVGMSTNMSLTRDAREYS